MLSPIALFFGFCGSQVTYLTTLVRIDLVFRTQATLELESHSCEDISSMFTPSNLKGYLKSAAKVIRGPEDIQVAMSFAKELLICLC